MEKVVLNMYRVHVYDQNDRMMFSFRVAASSRANAKLKVSSFMQENHPELNSDDYQFYTRSAGFETFWQ